MLALLHELPHGDGWTYRFESVDQDGASRIKLTAQPPEPGTEALDGE
jgi:hypothetical protein